MNGARTRAREHGAAFTLAFLIPVSQAHEETWLYMIYTRILICIWIFIVSDTCFGIFEIRREYHHCTLSWGLALINPNITVQMWPTWIKTKRKKIVSSRLFLLIQCVRIGCTAWNGSSLRSSPLTPDRMRARRTQRSLKSELRRVFDVLTSKSCHANMLNEGAPHRHMPPCQHICGKGDVSIWTPGFTGMMRRVLGSWAAL